ncbi:transglycosylase domain-containing protein [Wukongibacter sp. M2B1]|uniref:transglycosylase domain-containing protein n=1 Tax=Wukongibacter sp. M2B1 TaxID=3088895 RepID=UPI003D79CE59
MSESNGRRMRQNKEKRSNQTKTKTKKKNKILFFLQISFLLVILIGFVGAGVTVGLVKAALKDVKPVDPSKIPMMLDENSVIFDSSGNLLEKIQSNGLRTIVKYEDIDEDLKNAFRATEDRTFFEHQGFNYRRLAGAVIEGLKNKSMPKGTSTITQQLARNIYLAEIKSEKSITRKIKEAYYAVQIERALKKEQIFEAYLNTIYLGSGAKGVQAAAQTYFSKDAKDLDLVESALIAGITQSPTRHSPFITKKKVDVADDEYILDDSDELYTIVFNEECLDRFGDVLYFMRINDFITEAEYEEAKNVDLKTRLKPGKLKNTDISSFFTDLVKDEVIEALMAEFPDEITTREEAQNMLYTQGLQIYSTLDLDIQTKLENIYDDNSNFPKITAKKDKAGNILKPIKRNGKTVGYSIVLYKQENLISKDNNLIIPKGQFRYNDNGDLVLLKNNILTFSKTEDGILVRIKDSYKTDENNDLFSYKGGSVRISPQNKSLDKSNNLIVSSEFLKSSPEIFTTDSNGNLLISKEIYSIGSKGTIQPQSSAVIIDYRTGELKALIGGRNIKGQKQFNRAIHPRQPGSSIKPIAIYTPALDNGWTAASIIDDVPHYDGNGNRWPRNWYRDGFWGLMTIRKALQWSANVPPVILSERLGVSTSVEYLKKMGITTVVESGPRSDMNSSAMALGGMTHGISPLELTAAYGSLANKGVHIKPYSFTKVTDRNGTVILENKPLKNYVVSPQVAFIMTDMMRSGVEEQGVGRRADIKNMSVAGKTGTTSDKIDAWFVGYTPYYAGGVWIGNDLQTALPDGSKLSAILWNKIMTEVHKDLSDKEFERPDGIVQLPIDTKSGKLATELSKQAGHVRNEYFVEGTQPREPDDVHVEAVICEESGKLATEYCPDTSIGKRIMIKRPVPYNPEENDGIVPTDFKDELPTEYCDVHTSTSNENSINLDDLPIGTMVLPNGTKVLPDGSKILTDGTIIYPDGTVKHPSDNSNSGSKTILQDPDTVDSNQSDDDEDDNNREYDW